jgi:hypothetical protein
MDNFDIIKIEGNVIYGRCLITGEFIKVILNGC